MYISYVILYIYLDFFYTQLLNGCFGNPSRSYLLDACLFSLFVWKVGLPDLQLWSGTHRLWHFETDAVAEAKPFWGWDDPPFRVKLRPFGRFFSGWNPGIPRYRTPLGRGLHHLPGCIIFRFDLWKSEVWFPWKWDFQASFFFRDWDVKIVRGGYRSWMPWLAFFFLGGVENLEYQKVVSNWKIYLVAVIFLVFAWKTSIFVWLLII